MSTKQRITGGVIVLLVILGAVAVWAVVQSGEDETTEIAGMEMTSDEVEAMVRESMGKADLSDVKRVGPDDRADALVAEPDGEVATFELTARPLRWDYRERQNVAAWGYEQQVPGPEMRVVEGTRVRVTFTNNLPDPTTVHWHGVDVPFEADGVPGITQQPIEPGESYTYEFDAKPAGTHFYHAHGSGERDEARQLDMGLAGALIIVPKDEPKADVEQTLVLDEWQVEEDGLNAAMMAGAGHAAHAAGFNLFTINGRAAPDTTAITVQRGQTVRLRMINAGTSATHPMHLHGHNFSVTHIDGNPVPPGAVQRRNTVVLAPGETYDITFTADNPGVWMLHCHELHHADAGMMTLVQYEGYEPVDEEHAQTSGDSDEASHGKEPADGEH